MEHQLLAPWMLSHGRYFSALKETARADTPKNKIIGGLLCFFLKLKESIRPGGKSWYCFLLTKSNSRSQFYFSRRRAGTWWYEHSGRHCVQDKYLGCLWCDMNMKQADGSKRSGERIFFVVVLNNQSPVWSVPHHTLTATRWVQAECWAVQTAGWETLGLIWPQGTSAHSCA